MEHMAPWLSLFWRLGHRNGGGCLAPAWLWVLSVGVHCFKLSVADLVTAGLAALSCFAGANFLGNINLM